MQQNYENKFQQIKQNHQEEVESDNKRSKMKQAEEKRRLKELMTQKGDEERLFEKELGEMQSLQVRSLEKMNDDFKKEIDELIKINDNQNRRIEQLKDTHQVIRNDLEEKAEDEINKIKVLNSHELAIITDTGTEARSKLQAITLKLSQQHEKIEELKKELKRINDDLEAQKSANRQSKRDIKNQEMEIEERDKKILVKKTRKQELKRKTQELEKFRYVLDYKIKELKGDIDPREQEIQKLKDQATKMDQELKHFRRVNDSLELIVEDLRMRQDGMEKEMEKQNTKINEDELFFKKFSEDASECIVAVKEDKYKMVRDAIVMLHKKYIKEEIPNKNLEVNIQKEYSNQRIYLENSVNSLKKKLHTDSDAHCKDNIKLMKENSFLIQQINELRKELRFLKSQDLYQGRSSKTQTTPTPASNFSSPNNYQSPNSESPNVESFSARGNRKEVEMQKVEIEKLENEFKRILNEHDLLKNLRQSLPLLPPVSNRYENKEEKKESNES